MDNLGQDFLGNFLENQYLPCFQSVTRPSLDALGGTCIDNFFIKTNNFTYNACKVSNIFNDHYPLLVDFNFNYVDIKSTLQIPKDFIDLKTKLPTE